jgi:hypothetical protein
VPLLSKARHRGTCTCYVSVAIELPTHGATKGGVVRKEESVMYPPHTFMLVCELDIGKGGVFLGNAKSAPFKAVRVRRAPYLVVRERGGTQSS